MDSAIVDHVGNLVVNYKGQKYVKLKAMIDGSNGFTINNIGSIIHLIVTIKENGNELDVWYKSDKHINQKFYILLFPMNKDFEEALKQSDNKEISNTMKFEDDRIIFYYKRCKYSTIQKVYFAKINADQIPEKEVLLDGLCIRMMGYCFYQIEYITAKV